MPPMFAIQAATTHAAELSATRRHRARQPGRYADVIAVPAIHWTTSR